MISSPPSPTPSSRTLLDTSTDELRVRVNDIVESDALDKESALTITRLFHEAELHLQSECTRRDAQIAALRAELERCRMQAEFDRLAGRQIREESAVVASVAPLNRARSAR